MGLSLVTGPTLEPVTVEEVKDHLRIDASTEDTLLSRWIKVAREKCEGLQNKAYLTQTWDWYMDGFPGVPIPVPLPPLQSVTDIKYTNSSADESKVAATVYTVDTYSMPGRINLAYGQTWPSTTLRTLNGVYIRFIAGYTSRINVPEHIKEAIKLLVGHYYEHREETSNERILETIPEGVEALLNIDRMIKFP